MKKYIALHLIILSTLLLSFCPFSILYAQESFTDRYNISYITMNEGLPHNFVDDIYRDSHGFLWICMGGGGLSRYDGYEFINFTPDTPHCRLKSNFIRNVYEDNLQRLWVVSEGGTDIIDLSTLQSVPLIDEGKLSTDLSRQPASLVISDATGCIWLHCGNRLHRISFDEEGGIKEIRSLDAPGIYRSEITFSDIDQDGKVWIGLNGKLCKVNADAKGGLTAVPVAECLTFAPDTYFTDFIAKENEVWISTNLGLYRYNRNQNIVKHYEHIPDNPYSLSQNFLTSLAVTSDQQLIIATLRGISVYNPLKDNFERISDSFSETGSSLLNSNFVNCITVEGKHIWIGTESGGINKFTSKRLSIQNFLHDRENPQTLSHNPVNAIYEDNQGTLWVGTVEGGLNRKEAGSNRFTHYTHENGALSHNSVSAITADSQGRLWVGTWGGGINLLDRKNPKQALEVISTENGSGYPVDFIGALAYDSINNGMWIGANQGIFFYDFKSRKVLSPMADHAAEDIRGCIGSIIDKDGQLWMGCLDGVYVIDLHSRPRTSPDGSFSYRYLKYKLDDPSSGLIEKITCFYETGNGTLWLGSNGYGLYKRTVDAKGKECFTAYTTTQGLSNNSIHSILEDSKGCLWIATNNGLSRLLKSEERFINYTLQDGLSNTQFYWNAACRSTRNELYFGNVAGLVMIEYDLPDISQQPSQVRFTRLIVGNEEIRPGSKQLPLDISVTQEIRIHERQKSFSLEFSALNFEPDDAATYSYRLIGFDKEWIQVPSNRRFASYTNLSPGNYTLQVKYSSNNGNREEVVAELRIIILPYFYKTAWFILLVLFLLSLIVWQFYQWRIRSLKHQKELLHHKVEQRTHELNEQKQLLEKQTEELSRQNEVLKQQNEKITSQKAQLVQMARKVQELTLDKISFFTNITHEFRTPITLIIGPIERALKLSYNPQVIEQLHFVERNSKYLLSLVNQLMDFRKVDSGKFEIVKSKNNFLKFADELIIPFQAIARERNIQLKRYYHMHTPEIAYDEEAMHKVFTNLLSNAIKFTPNGGTVSLFVALLPPAGTRKGTLYICVSDTGSGIPTEDLPKIFGRFYQSQGQTKYPMYGQAGSGIGLYLCKRIVQIHGGDIYARNNQHIGCSLRILLPLSEETSSTVTEIVERHAQPDTPAFYQTDTLEKKGLRILVVEDNADMRGYIRSILRDKYEVTEAADGAEALDILKSQYIDFIISDLMMPVMDGLELSRKVKENISISHIPFLMLTAKTSQESRIESYRIGVDEYLLKPFDEILLLTRIENILENRKRYQKKFAIAMDVDVLNMEEESSDKKFINHVMEVMKEHYNNSYFEVSDFCEAVGVSKSLLNKKLQSLVGQPAGQFIRNYRLNIARELLLKNRENKSMNIAEIAYEVGFNDPKYFTRCFTKYFNATPSSLLNEEE
ncbi:two-component regulator propeller domain-containing protein [Bacteroides sp.]|uniref:two-component regulator propeller domain-containing protein n=1 Tax=Bacteroides sp. TaxID=29523 RepID=UPI002611243F|nr:two-component regulator propeller domain-containing protein [Bacteroides sp.]